MKCTSSTIVKTLEPDWRRLTAGMHAFLKQFRIKHCQRGNEDRAHNGLIDPKAWNGERAR